MRQQPSNPMQDITPNELHNFKFKFHRVDPVNNIDKWEDVVIEEWFWVATYTDGTRFYQYDLEAKLQQFGQEFRQFHQLREIDHDRLHLFQLVNTKNPDKHFTIIVKPDQMKIIYRYLRLHLYLHTQFEEHPTLHVFGYEKKINGFAHKFFNVIMPDGNVIATDDYNLIQYVNPEAERVIQELIDEDARRAEEAKRKREEELAKIQVDIDAKRRIPKPETNSVNQSSQT